MVRTSAIACAVAAVIALSGCVTQSQRDWSSFQSEVQAYLKNPNSPDYQAYPLDDVLFNDLLGIARKYNQPVYADIFIMLRLEAFKKRTGYANNYDALRKRFDEGDRTLGAYATAYRTNVLAAGKCAEFGHQEGSPAFNKCVYDLKMQWLGMQMDMQRQLLQSAPPIVIPDTNPPPAKVTRCVRGAGMFSNEVTCY